MKVIDGPTIDVYADKYMADKDRWDKMEEMGFDVDVVDAYGGFVPLDRDDKDNLSEAQENIQERFSLKQSPVGTDPFLKDKI